MIDKKNIKTDQLITNELVLVKPIRNITYNILVAVGTKISHLGCDALQRGMYVSSTCRIKMAGSTFLQKTTAYQPTL